MKNKCVSLMTIYGERILCIILEENKYQYFYKSEFGKGVILKEDVAEIEVIGDVVNE